MPAAPNASQASDRLVGILSGVDPRLLEPGRALLATVATQFDLLGRLGDDDRPLVDRYTFEGCLRLWLDADLASEVADELAALPGAAFRANAALLPPPIEVPWIRLAEDVVIYDPSRTPRPLRFPSEPGPMLAGAVRSAFPSLEPELVDPALGRRLGRLITDRAWRRSTLTAVTRQLGWWAAILTVLMGAIANAPAATDSDLWPLLMYLMAAAVGGWTLTVIGGWALTPRGQTLRDASPQDRVV